MIAVAPEGGGGASAETVTLAEPRTPSTVARMDAVPATNAVTRPDVETDAIDALELLYVIGRPVSTLPWASRTTTDACVVAPTAREVEPSDTETELTGDVGAATLTVVEPALLSTVATIDAMPPATAVTRPLVLTVATEVLELLQTKVFPVTTLPLASFATAVA